MAGSQSIKERGWRQGSVLSSPLASRSAAPRFSDWNADDRAIVLSQDCDVVHASYDVEPSIELIRGRIVTDENALVRHGRNPRRLQLDAGAGAFLDMSIHDRWVIPRRELEGDAPDDGLSIEVEDLLVLVEWVAKRYTRPAFPDAFNERRADASKKIEKVLKKHGRSITGIFLALDPNDELAEGESYRVLLRVTATKETLATRGTELELARVAKAIADALDDCNGIDVVDHALVSEAEFTLADLQYFQRWDWDYRSHSGDPGGDIARRP